MRAEQKKVIWFRGTRGGLTARYSAELGESGEDRDGEERRGEEVNKFGNNKRITWIMHCVDPQFTLNPGVLLCW